MLSDTETRVQHLKDCIAEFVRERDWEQFHSPKNLSMALAVEAAEVMELFQWKTEAEITDIRGDSRMMRRVREEIADVAVYLLNLCNRLDIDLCIAVLGKLAQNAKKYPIEDAKGRSTKYTELRRVQQAASVASVNEREHAPKQLELVLEEPVAVRGLGAETTRIDTAVEAGAL